ENVPHHINGFRTSYSQGRLPHKYRFYSFSFMNLCSATDRSNPLICLYIHSMTFLLTCSTNAAEEPSTSSSILQRSFTTPRSFSCSFLFASIPGYWMD